MPRLQLCCAKPTVLSDRRFRRGGVGVNDTWKVLHLVKLPHGFALENIGKYHVLGNWIAGFRGFKLMENHSNLFPGMRNLESMPKKSLAKGECNEHIIYA